MTESDTNSKYDDFFRHSLDLLCIAGFDGYFKELNPAWEHTLGYTVDELLSRPYLDFIHPGDRDATRAEADKLSTGRGTVEFENRFRCKDGGYKWLLWSSFTSVEDELFIVVARDITERKQTTEQYRLLVENAPYCIHQIDLAGRLIAMNKAGLEMLGLAEEADIINQPYLDSVANEDMERIGVLLEQAYQGHFSEGEFKSDNGRFFRSCFVPIPDSEGSVFRVLGITQDITDRKEAEHGLRDSEERFRSTFEQAAVGLAHVLPNGRWLRVNQRLCDIIGYSRDELLQLTFQEITPPDEVDSGEQYSRRLLSGELQNFSLEKHYVHKNGSLVWVNITVSLVRKPGGEPDYFITVVEDIDWRKQVELHLQRRDAILDAVNFAATGFLASSAWEKDIHQVLERLGQATDVSRVYIFKNHSGPDGVLLSSQLYEWVAPDITPQIDNPALQNFDWQAEGFSRWVDFLSRKEVIYGHVKTFPPEEQSLLVAQNIVSILVVPIFTDGTWWGMLGFDACYVEREWSLVEIDASHTAARTLGAAIRQQESAREMLRRNRELALLNKIIAISATDPEPGAVLEVACHELAQTFGLPQAAAALLNDTKTAAVIVAEYRLDGRTFVHHETISFQDGSGWRFLLNNKDFLTVEDALNDPRLAPLHVMMRRWNTVSVLVVPLLIGDETVGIIGLAATERRVFYGDEITLAGSVADQVAGVLARVKLAEGRRQLEAQFYQAQKMEAIGQLTAGIAHDFNNLLTAINGFAQLIKIKSLTASPLTEMADKILQAGERAARLVSQLLTFSRKQIVEPQLLELNVTVAKIEKMLAQIIGEHIQIELDLDPDLGLIRADLSQIEQVIVNLAVNARDAMPEGGRLTIKTANVMLGEDFAATHLEARSGEHVLLSVSDTGLGMSQEVQRHLFEPFFTTKAQGRGTGLGLATVYGIVKQNGGHIWVYSEEGQGTVFNIYLPRLRQASQPVILPPKEAEQPDGSETILLVEDAVGVRELVQRVLEERGYTVLVAQNGEAALDIAARYPGPIHLLLTDVVMPRMSGRVLAEQLVQNRPEMKVLFMSGYSDAAIAHHGILAPGISFLQKPFSPQALARSVRDVLDG